MLLLKPVFRIFNICETQGGEMFEGDVRLVLICWLSLLSQYLFILFFLKMWNEDFIALS